jgi:hypothetical protein
MQVVQTAESGDLAALRDGARDGRAAAMLNGGGDRTAAAAGSGAPVFIVHAGGGR